MATREQAGSRPARPGYQDRRPPPHGGRSLRGPAEEFDRKVQDLVRSAGIPVELAREVAAGTLDLNDVIKRMAFSDEVERIISRHDLNRALATQVALGHIDLELVLSRRRIAARAAEHKSRSTLEDARVSGQELSVGPHGHKTLRGRVLAVERYEVVVAATESGTEERVHKLQIKYAFPAADYKRVKKALSYDKARRDRSIEPVVRPQDRYACSDRRLGVACDRKTHVSAVTLEGEVFSGEIVWVARYEFAIRTRQGAEIVIFRHALDDLREGT